MSGSRVIMRSPISRHGKPSGPGAAQDAQRVVLRAGQSELFEPGFDPRLQRVGRTQQRKIGFLFPAGEWDVLLEFRLQTFRQTTGHGVRLVVMTSICQMADYTAMFEKRKIPL
jgi:hypothetical protein